MGGVPQHTVRLMPSSSESKRGEVGSGVQGALKGTYSHSRPSPEPEGTIQDMVGERRMRVLLKIYRPTAPRIYHSPVTTVRDLRARRALFSVSSVAFALHRARSSHTPRAAPGVPLTNPTVQRRWCVSPRSGGLAHAPRHSDPPCIPTGRQRQFRLTNAWKG